MSISAACIVRNKGALPVSGQGQDVPGIHSHRCDGIAQAPGTGERVQAGQDQVDGVRAVLTAGEDEAAEEMSIPNITMGILKISLR